MKNKENVGPILKWVGGKRQIINEINKYVPEEFKVYYEPFLGGAAVLLNLKPRSAIVNDVNSELINLYMVVKEKVDELIENLKKHKNEPDYFYDIRSLDREPENFQKLSDIERASRMLYLNKTCYNGLFRVNQQGQFNTPFGRYKNPNIVNEDVLRNVSKYFNTSNIQFLNKDYAKSLKGISKDDFVYFDPPYDPLSDSSYFTGYDKGGFNREEQIRLKLVCDELNNQGVRFLLSNSSTEFIHDLYKDYKIEIVRAKRAINSKSDKRGSVDEVLVRNYE